MNANVKAICDKCGHDFKVEPDGDGFDDSRAFVGVCDQCGNSTRLLLFSETGLAEHDQGIAATALESGKAQGLEDAKKEPQKK